MTPGSPRSPHDGHGPHTPASVVPAFDRAMVRRASTTDILRPDLPPGERLSERDPLILRSRATDVAASGGAVRLLDKAVLGVMVNRDRSPVVSAISGRPNRPGFQALVGAPARSGFRAAAAQAATQDVEQATLLGALLDDVPGAMIISGYVLAAMPQRSVPRERVPPVDVCSGWRGDGAMMGAIRRSGSMPALVGPIAPVLDTGEDLETWQQLAPLRPFDMRRRRRTDVRTAGPDLLAIDGFFRDSYVDEDGSELVVHEYGLSAQVQRSTMRIVSVVADPHVLPWQECPLAAGTAGRLVGGLVDDLRRELPRRLVGVSTCTHLNDLFRSLGDVRPLAARLPPY